MNLVDSVAKANNISPEIARALIAQESGGRASAVSPTGPRGLMQLSKGVGGSYRSDPYVNVTTGLKYLGELYNRYGNADLALRAYHDGPGVVDEALKEGALGKTGKVIDQDNMNVILNDHGIDRDESNSYVGAVRGRIQPMPSTPVPAAPTVTPRQANVTPPDTPTDWGFAGDLGRNADQMMRMIGSRLGGDQIASAAFATGPNADPKKSWSQNYDDELARQRGQNAQIKQENPTQAAVGGATGTVLGILGPSKLLGGVGRGIATNVGAGGTAANVAQYGGNVLGAGLGGGAEAAVQSPNPIGSPEFRSDVNTGFAAGAGPQAVIPAVGQVAKAAIPAITAVRQELGPIVGGVIQPTLEAGAKLAAQPGTQTLATKALQVLGLSEPNSPTGQVARAVTNKVGVTEPESDVFEQAKSYGIPTTTDKDGVTWFYNKDTQEWMRPAEPPKPNQLHPTPPTNPTPPPAEDQARGLGIETMKDADGTTWYKNPDTQEWMRPQ